MLPIIMDGKPLKALPRIKKSPCWKVFDIDGQLLYKGPKVFKYYQVPEAIYATNCRTGQSQLITGDKYILITR